MSSLEQDEFDIGAPDEIETKFELAAKYIEQNHSKFDQGNLLEIYGLYKQSTVGKCNVPKPGIFNLQGKAKWNAWNQYGDMEPKTAMSRYIDKLTSLVDGWDTSAAEDGPKIGSWVSKNTKIKLGM
jgi:acyl-CoA-binding protein